MVISSAASQSTKRAGSERTPSSGIRSQAPQERHDQSSQTTGSKAGFATWVVRSAGVTRNVSRCQSTRLARQA